MRRAIVILFQLALAIVCCFYLANKVDFRSLVGILADFPLFKVVGVLFMVPVLVLALGARLHFLSSGKVTIFAGSAGSLVCLALNSVMPAKLGEVFKARYLSTKSGVSLTEVFGFIFLERLLDVSALCCLVLGAGAFLGGWEQGVLTVLAVSGLLGFLAVLERRLPVDQWEFGFIPWGRGRFHVRSFAIGIHRSLKNGLLHPVLSTCVVWGGNIILICMILFWLFETGLAWQQGLCVCAAVYVGFSLPGLPAGIGIAEGAVVAVLTWFGVPKTDALAMALTIRFFTTIPSTLAGFLVYSLSGLGGGRSAVLSKEHG